MGRRVTGPASTSHSRLVRSFDTEQIGRSRLDAAFGLYLLAIIFQRSDPDRIGGLAMLIGVFSADRCSTFRLPGAYIGAVVRIPRASLTSAISQ
jgi:hypothetical protein